MKESSRHESLHQTAVDGYLADRYHCRIGVGERCVFKDLYDGYCDWVKRKGIGALLSPLMFGKMTKRRGFRTFKSDGVVYKIGVRPIRERKQLYLFDI
jgi:hypothetical protein